jgi:microsomal epoxide hydrolase
MDPRAMGALFIELMHRLGYTRYLVQGGDWGSVIASMIALDDEQHVVRSPCHMPRDWTGLTPATSALGLGSLLPHLHQD